MTLYRCTCADVACVPTRAQFMRREADKAAGLTSRDKRLSAHPAAKYDKAPAA